MLKKDPAKNSDIKESVAREHYERLVEELFKDMAHSTMTSVSGSGNVLYRLLEYYYRVISEYTKGEGFTDIIEKVEHLDKRILSHSSTLEKLEADVSSLKKKRGDIEIEGEWPSYASEEFAKVHENLVNLENTADDKAQILYYMMELQNLLGELEEKARVTNRRYEARLAASLRDICRVQEPSNISEEQIKRFTASTHALIEGWGKLNKEKVSWIRSRLLEIGLTWLPVTDKAAKDISKARALTE